MLECTLTLTPRLTLTLTLTPRVDTSSAQSSAETAEAGPRPYETRDT